MFARPTPALISVRELIPIDCFMSQDRQSWLPDTSPETPENSLFWTRKFVVLESKPIAPELEPEGLVEGTFGPASPTRNQGFSEMYQAVSLSCPVYLQQMTLISRLLLLLKQVSDRLPNFRVS